jgi:hypothetical protein
MLTSATESPVSQDQRIDQVGFVDELVKKYRDPLQKSIKARQIERDAKRATGLYFESLLVGYTPSTTSPEKLFRLLQREKITRAQFLSAISVKRDAALEFLSRDQLAEISEEGEPINKLNIVRIKGAELALVDAVKGLDEEAIRTAADRK